jgi:RNA polymerase sigma-70 factor, ECF subfamily
MNCTIQVSGPRLRLCTPGLWNMSNIFEQELKPALKRGYVAAFRILKSEAEAQDACQEAALRALKNERSYDRNRDFYPWFYRILKNICLDRLRQTKRISHDDKIVQQRASSESGSPENQVMSLQAANQINVAMTKLDPELQEMIELRHFQDLSYDEMAQILSCPIGTVMSRLYRARKQLKQQLEHLQKGQS